MAVGSNLLIHATLLVATRFLVLHFLIHRTDYMCNHDHFSKQLVLPSILLRKFLNQTSVIGFRFLDANLSFVLPATLQALIDS